MKTSSFVYLSQHREPWWVLDIGRPTACDTSFGGGKYKCPGHKFAIVQVCMSNHLSLLLPQLGTISYFVYNMCLPSQLFLPQISIILGLLVSHFDFVCTGDPVKDLLPHPRRVIGIRRPKFQQDCTVHMVKRINSWQRPQTSGA